MFPDSDSLPGLMPVDACLPTFALRTPLLDVLDGDSFCRADACGACLLLRLRYALPCRC
jgi:hypothetical protein